MEGKKELGEKGEQLAADFLSKLGYSILERNWRYGRLEVDIIAQNTDFLVVVEVKTRSSAYFGSPDEAVDHRKIDFLAEAAAAYQDQQDLDLETRFDIVSVIRNGADFEITHLLDAFRP